MYVGAGRGHLEETGMLGRSLPFAGKEGSMHARVELAAQADLVSLWHELATDAQAPDHIEITEHAEIIVSPPPAPRYQWIGHLVAEQLREQLGGVAVREVPVLTVTAGIRCPDVIWLPDERQPEMLARGPLKTVPPLVVEVLSPANREPEISHKIRGYLGSGAEEVIVVGLDGKLSFYRKDGIRQDSAFGVHLDLPGELFA
jgi:Uma2 family endonuclease